MGGGGGGSTGTKPSSRSNGAAGHAKSASKQLSGDPPGKDGSAHKAGAVVEGLNGYVSAEYCSQVPVTHGI